MTALLDPEIVNHPDQIDLDALLSVQDELCVSLLVSTTPAPRMRDVDSYRLRSHVMDALRRLEEFTDRDSVDDIAYRLEALVTSAENSPTDLAVAIFVSQSVGEVMQLSVAVQDRVVIDPTFATRDVVRCMQNNPEFLLLAITGSSATIHRYNQKYLSPTVDADFPLRRSGEHDEFVRRIDSGLGRRLRSESLPLVVMASSSALGAFLGQTRYAGLIAGVVLESPAGHSLASLERLGREALREHVADLRAAAEDTLRARVSQRRVVSGLLGCWSVAQADHPEMLLVEEAFEVPVRTCADGRYILPADDREEIDVIDDGVDDLIEMVIARGGHVAFLPDGALADLGRVAMSTRSSVALAG